MIEARDLRKRCGGKLAVGHLSLTVSPGKVAGFLGPNGAGEVDHDAPAAGPGPARLRTRQHRRQGRTVTCATRCAACRSATGGWPSRGLALLAAAHRVRAHRCRIRDWLRDRKRHERACLRCCWAAEAAHRRPGADWRAPGHGVRPHCRAPRPSAGLRGVAGDVLGPAAVALLTDRR
jgi:hypothetical protein